MRDFPFTQVANTYLVAAGISRASAVTATEASATVASHAHTLACFCLDALDILRDELPAAGLEGTAAKVGLHSGPLTAGLIGQSRCYYRIFGDTVNVGKPSSVGEVVNLQLPRPPPLLVTPPFSEPHDVDGRGSSLYVRSLAPRLP